MDKNSIKKTAQHTVERSQPNNKSLLAVLMSVPSKLLLSLMSSNLLAFSFSSTGHEGTPYRNIKKAPYRLLPNHYAPLDKKNQVPIPKVN